MAVTELTAEQRASVEVLVAARRIELVPRDARRAGAFLASAADRLGQLPLLTSASVAYDIAYDAALLAAYGFRTGNGPGQHEALGRFLRAVFDEPPANRAAALRNVGD